jgi:hypothetical protein
MCLGILDTNQSKNQKKRNQSMKDRNVIFTTLFALGFLALSCAPKAFGIVPAPDGGYPGRNTAEGQSALLSLSTGISNTAVGWFSLHALTTGSLNTGVGAGALYATTGNENTATGAAALFSNTTGTFNSANGSLALLHNANGYSNSAFGRAALFANTSGYDNTATGINALFSNTTGFWNTAIGSGALGGNTMGSLNTAIGFHALLSSTGESNTAMGVAALASNTDSFANTATGANALRSNTTGNGNIALGDQAGINLTTGDYNIDIGNFGVAGESSTIRIGDIQTQTFIAGVYGATASDGTTVYINSAGQLGTLTSSARFKQDIRSMDKVSEAVFALRPVTFQYKKELDPRGIPQFGLVAEEVAKINPDLVARDAEGKPYTVHYEAVNAMLLNEFIKEHRAVQVLEKQVATLIATVKEQASQIQKVNARSSPRDESVRSADLN